MNRLMRTLAATAAALLLTAGCQPETTSPTPKQPAHATFQVRVYDAAGHNLRRPIAVTVTALEADGDPAKGVDDVSGRPQPNPIRLMRVTPYEHRVSMGPGVVAASITVAGLVSYGETMACWVEQGGHEIGGTRAEKSLRSVARNAEGSISVSCMFAAGG